MSEKPKINSLSALDMLFANMMRSAKQKPQAKPRKNATLFVKRQQALNQRLRDYESRPLWDSATRGTYVKARHGELKIR